MSLQISSVFDRKKTISLLSLLIWLGPSMANSYRAQEMFTQFGLPKGVDEGQMDQPAKFTPSKCQKDYLEAMMHRCRLGDRICFADDLELEDVRDLAGYISEMCCLLRCQPKTLERLCCRNYQGKCRKAKCLGIHELGLMIEGEEQSRK